MKLSIFKWIPLFLFVSLITHSQESYTEENRYNKAVQTYTNGWNKIIPRYSKIQFAGSMGLLSIGTGWNYYRDHWETDLLFGIIPRNVDNNAKITLTLKQNYYPWDIHLSDKLSFAPLTCGVYINILFDREFWRSQPNKYPEKYYWFSTRFRSHIFLGERFTLDLNKEKSYHKSISFFYELSTCDLYLINKFGNKVLKPKDFLSLSFGIKLQIL
ncbi:MAG: hypothetical protein E7085_09560 [Parabacteroides distasonis]|nr:hypothetical protein [Parabacteroides distasonis]